MVSVAAWIFLIVGVFVTGISTYGVIVGTGALYNVFIGIALIIIGVILAYLRVPKD